MEKVHIDKEERRLNNLLWTRINEYKMLNDTLCEMISKDASSQTLTVMKDEINELLNEISEIKGQLSLFEDKDSEKEYGYYDDADKAWFEEKAANEKNLYDSVVKPKCEEKSCGSCPSKEKGKFWDSPSRKEMRGLMDDFFNSVDIRIGSNRFLVDLKSSLLIPEYMVESVSFDMASKIVFINVYDFVANIGSKEVPILELLKKAPKTFDFTIKHLTCDGSVLYTEHYSNCRLTNETFRRELDYGSDDFSTIGLTITYGDVTYEANNQA